MRAIKRSSLTIGATLALLAGASHREPKEQDMEIDRPIHYSKLQDGDVLTYRPGNPVGWLISKADQQPYGHSAIVSNGNVVELSPMYSGGGRSVPLTEIPKNTWNKVDVYRPKAPAKTREAAADTAEKLIGHGYGGKSLVYAAIDRLINRPLDHYLGVNVLSRKRTELPAYEAGRHCAEMVHDAYVLAGSPLTDKPSYMVSPGDLANIKGMKPMGYIDFSEKEKAGKEPSKTGGFLRKKFAAIDKFDWARYIASGLTGAATGAIGGVGMSSLLFPQEGNDVPEADRKRHTRNRMLLGALIGSGLGAGAHAFGTYGFDNYLSRQLARKDGSATSKAAAFDLTGALGGVAGGGLLGGLGGAALGHLLPEYESDGKGKVRKKSRALLGSLLGAGVGGLGGGIAGGMGYLPFLTSKEKSKSESKPRQTQPKQEPSQYGGRGDPRYRARPPLNEFAAKGQQVMNTAYNEAQKFKFETAQRLAKLINEIASKKKAKQDKANTEAYYVPDGVTENYLPTTKTVSITLPQDFQNSPALRAQAEMTSPTTAEKQYISMGGTSENYERLSNGLSPVRPTQTPERNAPVDLMGGRLSGGW